jgi:NAD dependent epimerase/dehydratase family enzyme
VCRQWEAATARRGRRRPGRAPAHRHRAAAGAGHSARSCRVFKLGLGAPLGSGRQWVSWISLQDEVAAIRHLLTATSPGPVNLVGPAPVTNRTSPRRWARACTGPTLPIKVPAFALRALLGPFADEGVLIGQRLAPKVLQASGFRFAHPMWTPRSRRSAER